MNSQINITASRSIRPEQSQPTYLGYINGKLTRFFLKHVPATNEYVKVAL